MGKSISGNEIAWTIFDKLSGYQEDIDCYVWTNRLSEDVFEMVVSDTNSESVIRTYQFSITTTTKKTERNSNAS